MNTEGNGKYLTFRTAINAKGPILGPYALIDLS